MNNTKTDTSSTLWSIGADLEDTHCKLKYLQDLLKIYDENFCDEMDFIKKQDGPACKYIHERCSLLQSLLWVATEYLYNTTDELQKKIYAVYAQSEKINHEKREMEDSTID